MKKMYDLHDLRPDVLLLQTGYVTIKDVQQDLYILDYPNLEVKQAFLKYLLDAFQEGVGRRIRSHILQLSRYLQQEDFTAFFETMQAIFASIPYDIESQAEISWQRQQNHADGDQLSPGTAESGGMEDSARQPVMQPQPGFLLRKEWRRKQWLVQKYR